MVISERLEYDLLGERALPNHLLYGIHTLRALEHTPLAGTGIPLSKFPTLVEALVHIKQAAALANNELDLLSNSKTEAIVSACLRVVRGEAREHFAVDVIQGDAVAATNMNTNEVIANLGLGYLGHQRGQYEFLQPQHEVNLSHDAHAVYPTAMRIACYHDSLELIGVMGVLRAAFEAKADEFGDRPKIGETCLRDARPLTLEQEFRTYAAMLTEVQEHLRVSLNQLCQINLGCTNKDNGASPAPQYAAVVCRYLAQITGVPLQTSGALIEANQDVGAFVQVSGTLKLAAVKLSKVCNDLHLLSSDPPDGFGEINLPQVQADSSFMPGRVNSGILEMVRQIAFEVVGHNLTITFAAAADPAQLNAFEPIIAYALLKSIQQLRDACRMLASRCVNGITIGHECLDHEVETSNGRFGNRLSISYVQLPCGE